MADYANSMKMHQASEMAPILDHFLALREPYFAASVDMVHEDEVLRLAHVYACAMRLRITPQRYAQIALDTLRFPPSNNPRRTLFALSSKKTFDRVRKALPQYKAEDLKLPRKFAYVGNVTGVPARRIAMKKALRSLRVVHGITQKVGNNDDALVTCLWMLRTELYPGVLYACYPIAAMWDQARDIGTCITEAREQSRILDYILERYPRKTAICATIKRLHALKPEGTEHEPTIDPANQDIITSRRDIRAGQHCIAAE